MKKLVIYIIITLIFIPCNVWANHYTYDDSTIFFDVDTLYWHEEEMDFDYEFLDKLWVSECGVVLTGVYDFYNELSYEETNGLSRTDFNYKNFFNDEFLVSLMPSSENGYNIDNYEYTTYKHKFMHFSGKLISLEESLATEIYITMINGYFFRIQLFKNDGITCTVPISEIVRTVGTSSYLPYYSNDVTINDATFSGKVNDNIEYSNQDLYLYIIILIIFSLIIFMIYPFIMIVTVNKVYKKSELYKMLKINSFVCSLILIILTIKTAFFGLWNIISAILFYYINKNVWKKTAVQDKKNEIKYKKVKANPNATYECPHCGELVKYKDNECQNCGMVLTIPEKDIVDD